MQNTRLYLFQILGIVMLVAGYFISDIPDSQSDMHFDLSASHVIRPPQNIGQNGFATDNGTSFSAHEQVPHKGRSVKHFSFKVGIPTQALDYYYVPLMSVVHVESLSESYFYLFFEEINPPPPKCC